MAGEGWNGVAMGVGEVWIEFRKEWFLQLLQPLNNPNLLLELDPVAQV